MQLSVVILNYNVSHFLHLCLLSVRKSIVGLDAEIIVVDNNSPDDSVAMVKSYFPEVILLENKENVGFAKANNQAVSIAKGEYVCILNPDTVVPEEVFIYTLQKAKMLPNLGIMSVQLIDGKGRFLPESKRNVPTPKVAIGKIFGLSPKKMGKYYASHISKDEEGEVAVLVGAFMLLKKIIYMQAGGFDERYFMYGEDIDFSYTVEKLGYQNYYYGSQKVIHFKGESTLKNAVYRKRFYGAMHLFFQKHFKKSNFINIVFFAGIKLMSLRPTKTNKFLPICFKQQLLLNSNTILAESTTNDLRHNIEERTGVKTTLVRAEEVFRNTAYKNATLCFVDGNKLSFSQIIMLLSSNANTNLYFRFLLYQNSVAIGSDTSTGRGQVISL